MKIHYINRFSSYKGTGIRGHSGYERVVDYNKSFSEIKTVHIINKILMRLFFKKRVPQNYLKVNISKELIAFFIGLFTGQPIFYLYADKDAYILPYLKRIFNLKRIKIYGTLHWPKGISENFSFYKNNFEKEFNGIITLSSSLCKEQDESYEIIKHGVDMDFWTNEECDVYQNLYVIIGISNRDHLGQVELINKIRKIDSDARFKLIAVGKEIYTYYEEISNIEIVKTRIKDLELRNIYRRTKAIILVQKFSLASNVVLECIAMQIPLITNNVGDIGEYLGEKYPLFIDAENIDNKLNRLCNDELFRSEVVNYIKGLRVDLEWTPIANRTVRFIAENNKDE